MASSPNHPPNTRNQRFFTLATADDDSNTAVARDALGNAIVSLPYESLEELCSQEFMAFVADAVAAVQGDGARPASHASVSPGVIFIDSDEDENENDGAAAAEFAAAWEAAVVAAEDDQRPGASCEDADLALALALQDEEEELERQREKQRQQRSGGAWQRPHSFSTVLGAAPNVLQLPPLAEERAAAAASLAEFPSLHHEAPQQQRPKQHHQQSRHQPAANFKSSSSPEKQRQRAEKPARPAAAAASSQNCDQNRDYTTCSCADVNDDYPLEALGYRRVGDALSSPNRFLDDAAAKAPAGWKEETLRRAAGEAKVGDVAGAAGAAGLSVASMRRMMNAGLKGSEKKQREPRGGGVAVVPSFKEGGSDGGGGGGSGAAADGDSLLRAGRTREYSRKSIRKLVADMLAAGWRPLAGRGGGHFVYERAVPPNNVKQLLVLPSTPSDRKSIEAVHARLQRLDRAAVEVRRQAEQEAAGNGPQL